MYTLRAFTIFVASALFAPMAQATLQSAANMTVTPQSKSRLSHAKELLGGSYQHSVVRKSEKIGDITSFVEATTKKFLPKLSKTVSKKLASAILSSAKQYELDPVFLMAVIQNESSFNPSRRGGAGEIGLMQIKPTTAEWIARVYDIEYEGEKTLLDPAMNVRIGAALMDKLRHQFESHSRLYLSAYNIGARKVRSMVEDKKIPKEYVQAVMKRYIAIYSAFKEEGNSLKRSEIAWAHTLDLTRKIAQVKIAQVKLSAKIVSKLDLKIMTEALKSEFKSN